MSQQPQPYSQNVLQNQRPEELDLDAWCRVTPSLASAVSLLPVPIYLQVSCQSARSCKAEGAHSVEWVLMGGTSMSGVENSFLIPGEFHAPSVP